MFICYNRWLKNNFLPIFITLILLLFVNTHTVNAVSNRDIYNAQVKLQELGYYLGKPDGIYGKKTRQAILGFQHDNGLDETGQLNKDTINKLIPAKGIEIFYKNKANNEVHSLAVKLKKYSIAMKVILLLPIAITLFLIESKFENSFLTAKIISIFLFISLLYFLDISFLDITTEINSFFKKIIKLPFFKNFLKNEDSIVTALSLLYVLFFIVSIKVLIFIVQITLFMVSQELKLIFVAVITSVYIITTIYLQNFFISIGNAFEIVNKNFSLSLFSCNIFTAHWSVYFLYITIFFLIHVVYFNNRSDFNFIKQRILLMIAGYLYIATIINKDSSMSKNIYIAIISVSIVLLLEPCIVSFIKKIIIDNTKKLFCKKVKESKLLNFLVKNIVIFPSLETLSVLNYIIFYLLLLKNRSQGDAGLFQLLFFTIIFLIIQYIVVLYLSSPIYKEFVENNEHEQELLNDSSVIIYYSTIYYFLAESYK